MFRTIKRIIRWTGDRKKRIYKGFVYSFFNSLFIAMPIMGTAIGLNLVIEDMNGTKKLTTDYVLYLLGFMIIALLGRFLFSYLKAKSQESVAYEVTADQRIEIGNILKRVSLGFFDNHNAGEIAASVTTDLSFVEMYGMKMIDTVVNGYICVFTMILCLLFYKVEIGLICFAGVLLSAFFLKLLGNKSDKNAPEHQYAQESMIASTIEYLRGIPIVKAFKQEGVSRKGIEDAYKKSKDINIKIEKEFIVFNSFHVLSLKIASIAIICVSALMANKGTMDMPTMIMMIMFSFVIFGNVEVINNATHVLELIDETMDKLDKINSAEYIDEKGVNKELSSYDIEFENVSFAYDKNEILKNVSFNIPQKSTTAIIGASGSGKTTICNLIARFYDVNDGKILIGGQNIKNMKCDGLLENISMVFQNVYLFHDTIYNNIRFGNPNASKKDIIKAAKKARCHDFIMSLPDKYDTMIGDAGSTLSGGEKQRISIARAILKDAPIVILDEATASVDPENEYEIQRAISSLVEGKTMITIAHRLATIQNADQILVVDNGEIVQKGSHDQLLKEEGIYKNFLSIREKAEGWSIV
ncbi:multidrug ABC transporter ATP-binding protein [Vallitalea longa]|uniref:Multidrug ABC transporter ATP-binding protein n=1 Tax=Vallitalea longa TaxID=2936439 RepID=A0A9W6DD96_9FIRM|nr:ABC transporter ATP-binding protein [Vallitalea longa]GKX27765.1 multidrug ABC transporter ATP-binding protein [Vallitalea longa]